MSGLTISCSAGSYYERKFSADFMVENISESPLPKGKAIDSIRTKVKDIIEEPTTRGFRVKILL